MNFRARAELTEWLDTEDVSFEAFSACMADLAAVNTATLARPPTIAFLRRAARGMQAGETLRVLDVGFGEGDMLRRIHRWGTRRGLVMQLSGVDLNPMSARAARAATPASMGIAYRTGDLFDMPQGEHDVVVSSLLTHHLTDDGIVAFLGWMERSAVRGWFVNDLHRHALAYHGFKALAAAARWHPIVRNDGPISVLRSFRRRDWAALLDRAGLAGVAEVRWHVPFRYCVSRLCHCFATGLAMTMLLQ